MVAINNTMAGVITSAGKAISSPEQRLILGGTALLTQPYIDLRSKDTDDDTKILSASKSVAKIIAGTTSGVLVRRACIASMAKLTKPGKLFCPKELSKIGPNSRLSEILGTLAATFVMLGTNFIWDAPVTKKLTNYFYSLASQKERK